VTFELVIFDCDGVLVDSEPLANRVLAERLTAIGLPTTFEQSVGDFMGRSWAANVAVIEERLGGPIPEGFADGYFDELYGTFASELEPIAGIRAALDEIALPSCVASSSAHDKIRRSLELTGLLDRFDGRIFSATDVEHGKPAPDLFLHAAATMGAEPARCVVVEDAPAGVEAGRAAGMTVLGYAGLTDAAELRAAGARTFERMTDLPSLIGPDPPIPAAPRHRRRSPEPISREPGGPTT
jgi:HAD superfamily hydrolase (TIGR01509 family)